MSVPKKKLSRTRTRSRRSHHKMDAVATTVCSNCGKNVRPHYACAACGYYKGKKVI